MNNCASLEIRVEEGRRSGAATADAWGLYQTISSRDLVEKLEMSYKLARCKRVKRMEATKTREKLRPKAPKLYCWSIDQVKFV